MEFAALVVGEALVVDALPARVHDDEVAARLAEPEEPDWELVERLKRIAEADELEEKPHPELPDAPILPEVTEKE